MKSFRFEVALIPLAEEGGGGGAEPSFFPFVFEVFQGSMQLLREVGMNVGMSPSVYLYQPLENSLVWLNHLSTPCKRLFRNQL